MSGRRRATVRPKPSKPPENHCIVCFQTSVENGPPLHKLPKCGHYYCGSCLSFNFSMALRSKPFSPAGCCPLTRRYDIEFLRAALAPVDVVTHMETYLAKIEEFECTDKLYCHVKTCSAFIPVDNRAQRVGTCPKCALKTCKRCKARSHFGRCSAETLNDLNGDKQLLELAESKQWKQCPSCSTMVERIQGCPHMTCVCGCEFCYMCGRTPFESHPCTRGTVAVIEGGAL